MTLFKNTLAFAQEMDKKDAISSFKDQFYFPQHKGENCVYFVGNSLGLQPKNTQSYLQEVLNDWKNLGVEGHFKAEKPWWDYHESRSESLAKIVGALPSEVSVMNSLSVNLHLLMVSFFKPNATQFKIICEHKAFPSDQYLINSQLKAQGLDPKEALIKIKPQKGTHYISTQSVLDTLDAHAHETALLFMGGLNYYSGQVLDMKTITAHAKKLGITVGWDLAHAAGNVPLQLHDWGVDFSAWCSYKYMNAGPGSVSGYFVHERHHNLSALTRFEGWWGHCKEERFLMKDTFVPEPDAKAWQVSNGSVLSIAPYWASLDIFDAVGFENLITKQKQLTGYLEFVLDAIAKKHQADFELITPKNPEERGSQISVYLHGYGKEVFDYLTQNGVFLDWREPNVIRLAPVPLYNSFEEVFRFGAILSEGLLLLQK